VTDYDTRVIVVVERHDDIVEDVVLYIYVVRASRIQSAEGRGGIPRHYIRVIDEAYAAEAICPIASVLEHIVPNDSVRGVEENGIPIARQEIIVMDQYRLTARDSIYSYMERAA
jgi:hypothetical protein